MMDPNEAIFKIFQTPSKLFIWEKDINSRYEALVKLFKDHLDNSDFMEAFEHIKWARQLMQNPSNRFKYTKFGVGGLHPRSRGHQFWSQAGEIMNKIVLLENKSEPACEHLDFNDQSENDYGLETDDQQSNVTIIDGREPTIRGAHYKLRPRRLLSHKMRRGTLYFLVEWAQDLPPEWEAESTLTSHFRAHFQASFELYKVEFPRKFQFVMAKPGIIEAYRG